VGSQLRRVEYPDRPSGRLWKSITAGLLLAAIGLSLQPPPLEYRLEVPFIASPPRASRLLQISAQPPVGEPIPLPGALERPAGSVEVFGLRLEALQRLTGSGSADSPLAVVKERGVDQPTVGRLVCRLSAPIRADQIDALLEAISRPHERELIGDADQLKARRWARWRVETYQHYAEHDSHAAHESPASGDHQLVGFPSMIGGAGTDRVPAVLAGASAAAAPLNPAVATAGVQVSGSPSEGSALEQLEWWRQQLSQLDQQSHVQLREARGFIVAQQPPRQRPVAKESLRPQLRSLLLAAAAGLLLVWLPWPRLVRQAGQARGERKPVAGSGELPPYLAGLDDLGSLHLPPSRSTLSTAARVSWGPLPTERRWSGRATAVGPLVRRIGQIISWRLADSLVAAWGTIALSRFMLDEQWRALARFEPLTALAYLLQRLS
jgi:hypothetical protein